MWLKSKGFVIAWNSGGTLITSKALRALVWQVSSRLIRRKSLGSITFGFFGMRGMNVALRLILNLPLAWKSRKTFIMSSFNTSHQAWKNAIEKFLGPNTFSPFIAFTTSNTSLSSNSLSNHIALAWPIESKEMPSYKGHQLNCLVYKFL